MSRAPEYSEVDADLERKTKRLVRRLLASLPALCALELVADCGKDRPGTCSSAGHAAHFVGETRHYVEVECVEMIDANLYPSRIEVPV